MRKLLAFVMVAALIGCGDNKSSDSTGPSGSVDVSGTYALQTINGSTLPYAIQNDSTIKVEMLSQTYNLASSGSFTQTSTLRITQTGQPSQTMTDAGSGTYTVGSGVIHFVEGTGSTADHFDMTIGASNTLTLNAGGMTFVYKH